MKKTIKKTRMETGGDFITGLPPRLPHPIAAHLQRGQRAEDKARLFLEDQGLQLIQRNYRCYQGEIDLIMQEADMIVFVEVRIRRRTDYGNAFESISYFKMQKLIRTATHFLQKQKWLYKVNSRFDIIAIHPIDGKLTLEWMKNAFTVDK